MTKKMAAAKASGVAFLGHKVRWGEGPDSGKAFDAGPVPIEAPMREGDEVLVPKPKKQKATAAEEAPAKRRSDDVSRDANKKKASAAEMPGPAKRRRRGTDE